MPLSRIYHDAPLQTGTQILLKQQAYEHLVKVLRLKAGDRLILFNGQGGQFRASIVAINKPKITVAVEHYDAHEAESSLEIHLGQALLKSDKMDFVIQKAVELGVTTITPLLTQRSVIKLSEQRQAKRLKHWQGILIHACEQCGRNSLPQIQQISPMSAWVKKYAGDCAFILNPFSKTQLPFKYTCLKTVSCLIGPEGGFTEEEISFAQQNGFTSLNLGKRILRAETATLATLAIFQSHWGDMGSLSK